MRNQNFQLPTRPVTSRHTSCPATGPATGLNDEHRPPPATRLSTDPSPIVQRDGAVIIQGAAVPLLYRAVHALAISHRRDGVASPPLLQEARTVLFRATTMSPPRHKDAGNAAGGPCSNGQYGVLIGSAAAARLLAMSRRQAQRLAAHDGDLLGAVRCGSVWLFRRDAVLALAARRKATK